MARLSLPSVLLVVAVASLTAACGRRGDPQFTPEEPAGVDGTFSKPAKTEPVKPDRAFVLDPLLGPKTRPAAEP